VRKFLLALLLLASPAHAWDVGKFDPGDPAASGFVLSWSDEFSSISTIDINQTRANGFKWYYCIFDSAGCGAPPAGMFTIVTEGGETFLRINSTWDTTEALTSGRSSNRGSEFVGASFSGGWFVEYETRFDPTKVMVPYNPNNEACYTVPPAQYIWNASPIYSATYDGVTQKITFTFPNDYLLIANQGLQITGVTPDGYNGWYNVVTAGTGTVTVDKTSDPGTFVNNGEGRINGWGRGAPYDGFGNSRGCTCFPGSQTQGCSGWPGIWSQSTTWVTLGYQKPGAIGEYPQYAENDILEYAYHNWYGSDRMMLMAILDWYGAFGVASPSAAIQSITFDNGTSTITYDSTAQIPPPKIGDTIYLSDVYTYATFYGYIEGNTLTVTEMIQGVIKPRDDWKSQIFESGISVNPLTTVFQQLSGTTGGVGTYLLNGNPQTIGSIGSPAFIVHRNILYDGQHTVTDVDGTTVKIAFDAHPGNFGTGRIATAPTCPSRDGEGHCRRAGNHASRIAYAPVGTNWNNWTKVGQLWVPGDASNGKHGFIETYINGVPVTRADWVTDVTEGGNPTIPHVLGVMDRVSMYLHLEAGAGYPIDVNYVRVWQRPQ
jgi:hypothetical protein